LRRWGKKVVRALERYEFHHQDETHVETNPSLTRVWHRRGQQATVPAAGTNRRLTVFGSVDVFGRGRVEVLEADQTSASFGRYLEVLEQRWQATGREIYLVLDNGPAHTSKASGAALAQRAGWLHPIWLSRYSPNLKYSPNLNKKEREWRRLKGTTRNHLARDLRTSANAPLTPYPSSSRSGSIAATTSERGNNLAA
jgi:hypothetical protein